MSTPDPDIERLRELAAETQSAASRILAERDRYRETLEEIASYHEHGRHSAITPATLARRARQALTWVVDSEAGKR